MKMAKANFQGSSRTGMRTLTIFATVLLSVFFCGMTSSHAAEGKKGNIRVLKVQGDVISIDNKTKESEPLKEGAFIQQGRELKTGSGSSSILLFSNGTTLTVEENTTFTVEKFLQTQFDSTVVAYQKIKEEPSISQTKVHVSEGSIVADIAKLDKESSFSIATPVGTAGIRGTIIRVVVTPANGGNSRSVTVDLLEGLIDFAAIDGKTFTLSSGTTITIDATGNKLTPSEVRPLSEEAKKEIAKLVAEALAAILPGSIYDGAADGAPELIGSETDEDGGNIGGVQGAGTTGYSGLGGSGAGGGNGGGSSPTPAPTPTPRPTPPPLPPPAS